MQMPLQVHSNPKTSVGSTQNKKQKSGSNVGTEKSGVQARTAKGSTGRPLQADIGGCNGMFGYCTNRTQAPMPVVCVLCMCCSAPPLISKASRNVLAPAESCLTS